MTTEALVPYVTVIALPLLLWLLFAAFRWRYLRHVKSTIYAPSSPAAFDAGETFARASASPIELRWIDAASISAIPAPPAVDEARSHTRSMRAAFAIAGFAFVVPAAVIVWASMRTNGIDPRAAVSLAYFSTLPGVLLIAAFASRGWRPWAAEGLAWLALAFLLLVGPLHLRPLASLGIIVSGLDYVSLALLAVVPLTLRAIRPLLAGFVPLVALWISFAALLSLLLARLGLTLEGNFTARAVAGGLVAGLVGVGVTIWQIRRGLRASFVILLFVMAAIGAVAAAYLPFIMVVAAIGGIGTNGLITLAVWVLFSRFLSLKSRGLLPDEVLHYSLCWIVVTTLLPILASSGWNIAPAAIAIFFLQAATLVLMLRRRQLRSAVHARARLLLLRVFNLERVGNRLLDVLDDSWRRIGRVDLVVGLDMAVRTLGAAALEGFLVGQVNRHFLKTKDEADRRIAALQQDLALDLRYPLNELHCAPGVWPHVVDALAENADVVLMDLRGFKAANSGAAFELGLLLKRVPLARVVLLADRRTDERLLTEVVQYTWSNLPGDSPNVSDSRPRLDIVRCSGRRTIDAAAIANRIFAAAQSALTPHTALLPQRA